MHRCDFIIRRFYPVVWLGARCKIASNELGLRAAWRSKPPDEQASVYGSGEAELECPVVGRYFRRRPSYGLKVGKVSAIDRNYLPRNVGSCRRGEEHDRSGDLGRMAPAAE
jgi:hypothetical protein